MVDRSQKLLKGFQKAVKKALVATGLSESCCKALKKLLKRVPKAASKPAASKPSTNIVKAPKSSIQNSENKNLKTRKINIERRWHNSYKAPKKCLLMFQNPLKADLISR